MEGRKRGLKMRIVTRMNGILNVETDTMIMVMSTMKVKLTIR